MLLWSYFSVVVTDPGGVPPNWKPELDSEKGDTDQLVSAGYGDTDGSPNQNARFCRKCNVFRPPRCHHCSICGFLMHTFFLNLFLGSKIFIGNYIQIKSALLCSFRWKMHIENGPSLRVGCQLCWCIELQVFSPVLGTYPYVKSCSMHAHIQSHLDQRWSTIVRIEVDCFIIWIYDFTS